MIRGIKSKENAPLPKGSCGHTTCKIPHILVMRMSCYRLEINWIIVAIGI